MVAVGEHSYNDVITSMACDVFAWPCHVQWQAICPAHIPQQMYA